MSTLTQSEYAVLRLIKNGNTLPAIAESTGSTYGSVRSTARRLARQGFVSRNGRGEPLTVEVDLRKVRPSRSR